MNEQLQPLREHIDRIDHQLLLLLSERMEHVVQIGNIKKHLNMEALQSSRWQEVLSDRETAGQELGLSTGLVHAIWESIHAEALKIEENI